MSRIFASTHPLVRTHLTALRAKQTGPAEFRRLVRTLSFQLAHEATADLPTEVRPVETPLGMADGYASAIRVGLVPILRAGLGMADGVLELLPDAEVWHLGLFRDELTLEPTQYYNKLPQPAGFRLGLVLDPMLATGGSATWACRLLREAGITHLKYLALIAAPEGVERLSRAEPDMPIHVGAIDDRLNEVGFIHPGLGDAGDRQFGTFPH